MTLLGYWDRWPSLATEPEPRSTQRCIPLGSLSQVPASVVVKVMAPRSKKWKAESHCCRVVVNTVCVIKYDMWLPIEVKWFPQTALSASLYFTLLWCKCHWCSFCNLITGDASEVNEPRPRLMLLLMMGQHKPAVRPSPVIQCYWCLFQTDRRSFLTTDTAADVLEPAHCKQP